ncbi:hypothetical protein [Microbacterium atlanticum]|uniref:hypothetical protein n=1 Tax=Microbacterium atlanticum TaxID=2782168 RepID=UPI001886FA65|nr:hypothetical protein [Microbacterium atlanticum]
MKDLAQATIAIDNPADLHLVVDELLGSLRSLVQVADQLAHAHMHHRGRARTHDGDAALGAHEADGATWALVRTRELLHAAQGATDLASQDSGQIAWAPIEKSERWVNVVFQQGIDAHEALDILERSGAQAAIRHLSRWDYGDETTEAALANGYVYEGIPHCPTDHTAEDPASGYALIHNPTLGYVSLVRRFRSGADDLGDASPATKAPAEPSPSRATPHWISSRPSVHRAGARSVSL